MNVKGASNAKKEDAEPIDEDVKNNMMEFERDRYDFWNRRSFDARIYCILLNMSNCVWQLGAIVSPVTP